MLFLRRGKNKAYNRQPWWTKPHMFFCITSVCFWLLVCWSFAQVHQQYKHIQREGLSLEEMAVVRCNPAHTSVATCAHRGNAAELLAAKGGSTAAPVVEQMQLLWAAGIRCYDMDVIQLQGGEFVVGHPADLAARVDVAALAVNSSSSRHDDAASSSSSSKNQQQKKLKAAATPVSADQLHGFSLRELRSAGLSEDAAPSLPALLQTFGQLITATASSINISSSDRDALLRSAQEAAQERSWQQVPVLSLELKGPDAVDAQAFLKVGQLAAAAGVSQHILLWMRQMPASVAAAARARAAAAADVGSSSSKSSAQHSPSSADDEVVVVTDLAREVKQALSTNISSNSRAATSSTTNVTSMAGAVADRPLLGLIVADVLLKQPQLAALQHDASKLTPALLAAAGGTGSGGANTTAAGVAAVLDTFDVLAPSIKLPAAVLRSFLDNTACLAWTLEGAGHVRKALWLGMDVAITNTPMAQLDVVTKEEAGFCKAT